MPAPGSSSPSAEHAATRRRASPDDPEARETASPVVCLSEQYVRRAQAGLILWVRASTWRLGGCGDPQLELLVIRRRRLRHRDIELLGGVPNRSEEELTDSGITQSGGRELQESFA